MEEDLGPELSPARRSGLLEDRLAVVLHRVSRDEQTLGDRRGVESLGDERRDLPRSWAEGERLESQRRRSVLGRALQDHRHPPRRAVGQRAVQRQPPAGGRHAERRRLRAVRAGRPRVVALRTADGRRRVANEAKTFTSSRRYSPARTRRPRSAPSRRSKASISPAGCTSPSRSSATPPEHLARPGERCRGADSVWRSRLHDDRLITNVRCHEPHPPAALARPRHPTKIALLRSDASVRPCVRAVHDPHHQRRGDSQ